MVSLYYQDHTCQTNCFQGEAFAAYDPCGNMISLVANNTGAEVWARAVDKNSNATIGIYNLYNMEIPFSALATIHPSYDQPINGPIEFHIPEQGQWDLKELLANMTRVNTTVGENGVDATIGGDDDCEDTICESKDPCEDENLIRNGMGFGVKHWDRIGQDYEWQLFEVWDQDEDGNWYHAGYIWLLVPTWFIESIDEQAKDRFRDQGFSEDHIDRISEQMGDCYERGASRVDCYPIRCPDGTCGIECTGKFGTERGDPFNSCE
jgi:hypothetical protein